MRLIFNIKHLPASNRAEQARDHIPSPTSIVTTGRNMISSLMNDAAYAEACGNRKVFELATTLDSIFDQHDAK